MIQRDRDTKWVAVFHGVFTSDRDSETPIAVDLSMDKIACREDLGGLLPSDHCAASLQPWFSTVDHGAWRSCLERRRLGDAGAAMHSGVLG